MARTRPFDILLFKSLVAEHQEMVINTCYRFVFNREDAVKRLGRYSLGLMGAVFKKPQRWQNVKQAVETLMVSRPGKEITFDLLSRTLAKLKLENVSAARMREWGQHKKLGSYRPAAGWQERLESLCSAVYVGPVPKSGTFPTSSPVRRLVSAAALARMSLLPAGP